MGAIKYHGIGYVVKFDLTPNNVWAGYQYSDGQYCWASGQTKKDAAKNLVKNHPEYFNAS